MKALGQARPQEDSEVEKMTKLKLDERLGFGSEEATRQLQSDTRDSEPKLKVVSIKCNAQNAVQPSKG